MPVEIHPAPKGAGILLVLYISTKYIWALLESFSTDKNYVLSDVLPPGVGRADKRTLISHRRIS